MKPEQLKVNNEIKASEVLIIFENGTQDRITLKQAILMAQQDNKDVVQVAYNDIPVCKIMDYSKYVYQQNKRKKEQQKKQRQNMQELKEIRISATIDKGDIITKANQASKFLTDNKKVKVSLKLRGRENQDYALVTMNTFLDNIPCTYNRPEAPQIEGKIISIVLSPSKT